VRQKYSEGVVKVTYKLACMNDDECLDLALAAQVKALSY
jgi:hypothetical protein